MSSTSSSSSSLSPSPVPIVALHPVVLEVAGRPVPLRLRVSAPATGAPLPLLLLSHGHGPSNYVSSLHGYAPLADAFAAAGFVVIQPTHLDSKTLPLRDSDHPDAPLFWRSRARDMSYVLDTLDAVEQAAPFVAGRIDRDRVGVVGHSMGGHTASVLLGARHLGPGGEVTSVADARIRAGVLLAAPGRGEALTPTAAARYPFFATVDFSTMTTPTLVVAGERDEGAHLTTAGADWYVDPYRLAPAPKALATLVDAEHDLGGVAGYDLAETTDDSPARVAVVQRLSSAWLRSRLYPGDPAWEDAQAELRGSALVGRLESK